MARSLKRRHFITIDKLVFSSPAWRTLPDPATRLWVDLRTLFKGGNNGLITPTFATMRPMGWTSKSKHARALAELEHRGFIRYTRKVGPNVFQKASRIRFTDLATVRNEQELIDGAGPTTEFLAWQEPPKRKFTFPVRRGGAAPSSGEEPPREKGNGKATPPPQKGNGKQPGKPRQRLISAQFTPTHTRSPPHGDIST